MPPTAAPRSSASDVGGESLIKKAPLLTRAEAASRKLLIVNGKAYAAEGYLSSHPGGAVLSTYLGADATDIFRAFHSGSKRSLAELDGLFVADVEPAAPAAAGGRGAAAAAPTFEQDVRALAAKMAAAGMFKTDMVYYAGLVARTAALGVAAVVLALAAGPGAPGVKLCAALLLAVFWQQSGWLAHDFAHNQVRGVEDGNGEAARRQGSPPACVSAARATPPLCHFLPPRSTPSPGRYFPTARSTHG